MNIEIKYKPLSVNKCWQGKRFKTPEYKKYERDLLLLMPKMKLPESPFSVSIECGFSSKLADIDNISKPLIDILQKRYNFDDKEIYSLYLLKKIVPKGDEYMRIKFENYEL